MSRKLVDGIAVCVISSLVPCFLLPRRLSDVCWGYLALYSCTSEPPQLLPKPAAQL